MQVFAQPRKPLLGKVAYDARAARLVFELRATDPRAGFAPRRLTQAAGLIEEARDRAAARLSEALPACRADLDRYLIGRGASDADKAARVRIVPIPSVGHPGADMMIRRLVVYVPPSCPLRPDDLGWAFGQVCWTDGDGALVSELHHGDGEDGMVEGYERAGRRWRSVTPLALSGTRRAAGRVRELLAKYREIELLIKIGEYKQGSDPIADEANRKIGAINGTLTQGLHETSSLDETIQQMRQVVGG